MEELWRSWGELVGKARQEAQLSQRALARLVGASQTAIAHLERGDNGASDEMRIKLASALNKNVEDLFPYPQLVKGVSQ